MLAKVIFLVGVLSLIGSCASPPTQELSDARQSIEAAKSPADGEGLVWLGSAERWLLSAEHWLEQGEYEFARQDAIRAKDDAHRAAANCCTSPSDYRQYNSETTRFFSLY